MPFMPKTEYLPRQARDKRVKGTSVENSQNRFVSFRFVSLRHAALATSRRSTGSSQWSCIPTSPAVTRRSLPRCCYNTAAQEKRSSFLVLESFFMTVPSLSWQLMII